LIDEVHPEVRCWICGYSFSTGVVDRFLSDEFQAHGTKLKFVDVFKPIGRVNNDTRIEIDHVLPFSAGGAEGDNLRLACGWCNRNKAAAFSIYEQAITPSAVNLSSKRRINIPRPIWVLRLLATRRRCEAQGGCECRTSTHELTVALHNPAGDPNPMNLMVICRDHDPMSADRFVPSDGTI
jgi:hypothetical protein